MAGHPENPGFIPGDHWVECDICGLEYRQSDIRMTWDNLAVCKFDYDPRHPQDFVRGVKDDIAAQGIVRPAKDDSFVSTMCTSREAVADTAIAGCAIAEFNGGDTTIPTGTF